MTDEDRFKLLGEYSTPRVRIGTRIMCEVRDCDLIVVAFSNGRIPWPLGRAEGTSARSLIVYGGLLEAVKRESNQAVCHWFGVTAQTVSKWRRLLDVDTANEGTHRLRADHASEDWFADAREKAHAKTSDPERNAKIAAAHRGKKRRASDMKPAQEANRGRKHSDEERRKRSESHKARGTRPPAAGDAWTADEDALLLILAPSEVATRTGKTLSAVYSRRSKLGINKGRTTRNRSTS